ncbi:hypothetical protein MCHI_001856 [Candidatus Magnetoovum chiemensis]|nr:hypothetical protein MCHI_001856 [Candidatus Magnetoovum chiemensis]
MPYSNNPIETQERRQQLLTDLMNEYGHNFSKQYAAGSFGCHEILDRTAFIINSCYAAILIRAVFYQNAY